MRCCCACSDARRTGAARNCFEGWLLFALPSVTLLAASPLAAVCGEVSLRPRPGREASVLQLCLQVTRSRL